MDSKIFNGFNLLLRIDASGYDMITFHLRIYFL